MYFIRKYKNLQLTFLNYTPHSTDTSDWRVRHVVLGQVDGDEHGAAARGADESHVRPGHLLRRPLL